MNKGMSECLWSDYTKEEWDRAIRYAEEHADEPRHPEDFWFAKASDGVNTLSVLAELEPAPSEDLAQFLFATLTASNRLLAEQLRKAQ